MKVTFDPLSCLMFVESFQREVEFFNRLENNLNCFNHLPCGVPQLLTNIYIASIRNMIFCRNYVYFFKFKNPYLNPCYFTNLFLLFLKLTTEKLWITCMTCICGWGRAPGSAPLVQPLLPWTLFIHIFIDVNICCWLSIICANRDLRMLKIYIPGNS